MIGLTSSEGQGTGNVVEYNTFQNVGLYGVVMDGVSHVRINHNTNIDANGCMESDNNTQIKIDDICDSNTYQHINGTGCENTPSGVSGCPQHMYDTGGANGLNYSGVTVSNDSVVGGPVDLLESNGGQPMATYANDTGFTVR